MRGGSSSGRGGSDGWRGLVVFPVQTAGLSWPGCQENTAPGVGLVPLPPIEGASSPELPRGATRLSPASAQPSPWQPAGLVQGSPPRLLGLPSRGRTPSWAPSPHPRSSGKAACVTPPYMGATGTRGSRGQLPGFQSQLRPALCSCGITPGRWLCRSVPQCPLAGVTIIVTA